MPENDTQNRMLEARCFALESHVNYLAGELLKIRNAEPQAIDGAKARE